MTDHTPTPEAATREVQGHCPACGRASLTLGTGGYVVCGHLECPDPEDATRLLQRGPVTADFAEAGKRMPALYANLTDALGLTPSASWDAIVRRARKLAADPLRRMLDSPVANVAALAAAAREEADEAHEERRRTLADALGEHPTVPWERLTGRAATATAAATERAAALHDARDALGAAGYGPDSDDWPAIAPAIRKLAADVKLLRGNSEVDRREAGLRREALAGALGLGTGAGWDAVTDRARQVTADLDVARTGDAPWVTAYREDLEDAKKRAEQAEAALNRVWDLADRWEHALAPDLLYARTLRAALDGEQPDAGAGSNTISPPFMAPCSRCRAATARCDAKGRFLCQHCDSIEQVSGEQAAEPGPREVCCVCGSPDVVYHNCDEQPFCWPCADCGCNQIPCVRTGINDPAVSAEPEAPCFHPSWQTEPTVGARKCTDCGEWLDPQPPAPAELDGAALWAAIRDHAFNDTQWWRKVNQRRDHAQLNTYVQRGPGHTSTR